MSIETLSYPVGKFKAPTKIDAKERADWIEEIAAVPSLLRRAVTGLSDRQLDTRYRPEGWTVRQVVHHLPDSHLNAYVRHKLALTENQPTIVPYDEALWAELPEAKSGPVALSLDLLDAVHQRWLASWRGLAPEQFERPPPSRGGSHVLALPAGALRLARATSRRPDHEPRGAGRLDQEQVTRDGAE